jgi:hypothetical protein
MILVKVWYAKANEAKMITVPKDCNIKKGDWVELVKLEHAKKKN